MQLLVSISGAEEQHTLSLEGIAPRVIGFIVIAYCCWCGEQFLSSSRHQRFCRDACRKTAFRKKACSTTQLDPG